MSAQKCSCSSQKCGTERAVNEISRTKKAKRSCNGHQFQSCLPLEIAAEIRNDPFSPFPLPRPLSLCLPFFFSLSVTFRLSTARPLHPSTDVAIVKFFLCSIFFSLFRVSLWFFFLFRVFSISNFFPLSCFFSL